MTDYKTFWTRFVNYVNNGNSVITKKKTAELKKISKRSVEKKEYRKLYEHFRRHWRSIHTVEKRRMYDRMRTLGKKYWFKIKLD